MGCCRCLRQKEIYEDIYRFIDTVTHKDITLYRRICVQTGGFPLDRCINTSV
jgi:hypothetical protein